MMLQTDLVGLPDGFSIYEWSLRSKSTLESTQWNRATELGLDCIHRALDVGCATISTVQSQAAC